VSAVSRLRLVKERLDVLATHKKPPSDAKRWELAPLDPVTDRLQGHAEDLRRLGDSQELVVSHAKQTK
jgi:hypothetical protein